MRLLGRKSMVSILNVILNVSWYGLIIVVCVPAVYQLIKVLVPGLALHSVPGSFTFELSGLVIRFHEMSAVDLNGVFTKLILLTIPLIAVSLVIIHQLRRITATLVAEDPFRAENAGRIRIIGFAILVGSLFKSAIATMVGYFVMENVVAQGIEFNARLSPDGTVIFLGLVVLVLSEVFRQGAMLKEEQDLTI